MRSTGVRAEAAVAATVERARGVVGEGGGVGAEDGLPEGGVAEAVRGDSTGLTSAGLTLAGLTSAGLTSAGLVDAAVCALAAGAAFWEAFGAALGEGFGEGFGDLAGAGFGVAVFPGFAAVTDSTAALGFEFAASPPVPGLRVGVFVTSSCLFDPVDGAPAAGRGEMRSFLTTLP
ncbi:MAG: hypothetical protein EA385_03190 [Salinarimonadaceae bacterium]|nr:MAG: hypothetical protein EA385_03190 [Salinarimonadaceae bacterium]